MKKFLVFTAILLNSLHMAYCCGFEPYGEYIRYSLFNPKYFDYSDYGAFNYSSEIFGFGYGSDNRYASNVHDWHQYTHKQVSLSEIDLLLHHSSITDINDEAKNQFVQYLFKNKEESVIQYLKMAKNCEAYNGLAQDDLWERGDSLNLNYTDILQKLETATSAEKSAYLKRKYAFLTIRTAFYGRNHDIIRKLFKQHFIGTKKDYLYYWALYFHAFESPTKDVEIANVMANSQEKKFASYFYFHEKFNLKNALTKTKVQKEKANLYAYASLQRLEPNLHYLKKIYKYTHKSRMLDFLLLREINKIEDWIYTPYYTNYLPSIEHSLFEYWEDKPLKDRSTEIMRARSERDRVYAQQVLDFVNVIDFRKVENIILWKAVQIQLLFMTRNYSDCLSKIKAFERGYKKEKCYAQIEKIKALCLISKQKVGKAVINKATKQIITKYMDDGLFLFALGRELEYRKNLPDGMALIALQKGNVNYEEYEEFNTATWRGNRLKKSGNLKYFHNYFDYLDFVYSANELQIIVNKIQQNKFNDSDKIIYNALLHDQNYLVDMLGTKYIRENKLKLAEKTFLSLPEKYWEGNYNPWERDKYGGEYTFDKNPFYDIKYTKSFIPKEEKYIVNKLSVTQHLIKYLEIAQNRNTQNKEYYYFLIANCYLNMTQYGHSWMMRRYSNYNSYRQGNRESFIDDMEYRNCRLSQKYYHLAYLHSKTEKFKALCLRMEDFVEDYNKPDDRNQKFKRLKALYPKYFNELSNCENLEEYFRARR